MANPTTNYGFILPTPTDLVTDLPADFDVALQGVDTRLKALQPGTTLGDLNYSSATANTNTRLGIGTTGQVLTVTGGLPAWTTIGGGGWTQIAAANLPTGATQVTISSIPTTYKFLRLYVRDYTTSVTSTNFGVRINADASTLYQTIASYPSITSAATDTSISIGQVLVNGVDNYAILDFNNYADTTTTKQWQQQSFSATTASNFISRVSFGSYRSNSAITSLQILDTGGSPNNFSAGSYILWGSN